MSYFRHLWLNYKAWKRYKKLPKQFQRPDGMYPSETYFKYHPLSTFGGKRVLNFGCGKSVFVAPNVTNVDVVPGDHISVIDPSRSLGQFGTDFDLIIANHVLEHVPDWFETFKEMTAMLVPGGMIEVWIPPISADTAFSFRDHINRIGLRSFDGIGPGASGGSNALASDEFSKFTSLQKLILVSYAQRPIIKWWTMIVPACVLSWMIQHLRNIVSEENYMFRKLP